MVPNLPVSRVPLSFATLCALLASLASADLTYTDATTNCVDQSVNGQAVYCCNGACLDGTSIFDTTGQCKGFNNACTDPPSVPTCSPNQVFTNIQDQTVDAGIGSCYVNCDWSRDIWTHSCCDCPAGFYGYHSTCDGPEGRYVSFCVGCDGDGETLSYNATNGYSCSSAASTSPATPTITPTPTPTTATSTSTASATATGSAACALANALSSYTSALGLVSTWAGAACGVAGVGDVAVNLLGLAYSTAVNALNPSSGLLGNNAAALTAVVASSLIFLGLPEEIGAAGVLGIGAAAFEELCDINTVLNLAFTTAGVFESAYLKRYCDDDPVSKRFAAGAEPERRELAPRAGSGVNPCAEFVALFPLNYSIPAVGVAACQEIQGEDVAAIADPGLANATAVLQQFCGSGNLTTLVNFANLLTAMKAAVPYCAIPANTTVNSTSSSGTSSTTATPGLSSTLLTSVYEGTTSTGPATTYPQTASTTSTVYYTSVYTVPCSEQGCSASVTTETIALYTTVCPVTETGSSTSTPELYTSPGSTYSMPEQYTSSESTYSMSPETSVPSTPTTSVSTAPQSQPQPAGSASPTPAAMSPPPSTVPGYSSESPSQAPGTAITSAGVAVVPSTPLPTPQQVTAAGARLSSSVVLAVLAGLGVIIGA